MVTRKATSIISSSSISSKAATMTALAMFALSSCAAVLFYHKSQTRRKKQKQPAKRQPKQKPFRKSKGGKNTTSGKRSNHSSIEHDDDDNNHHHGKENDEFSYDTDETPIKSNQFSHLPPHIQREMRKEEKRLEKLSYLAMKTPMYDNVRMLDPQGELLCTISIKKAKWYIEKKLASWTDEKNPNVIQLFFEPKNRSNRGEKGVYVRSDKLNQCVACGNTEYHMRHYVVPFAYRTLFPPRYKSHLSHDIVILCPKCHVYCDQQRQLRMKEIEQSLRRPGEENTAREYTTDQTLYHLRKCALALMRSRNKLPEEKLLNFETLVRTHLNLTMDMNVPLTTEQLQQAVDVDYKIKNEEYVSGPELVAADLGENEEKIKDFVIGWRQHFLETARPKFLPQGWGLDSNMVCGED